MVSHSSDGVGSRRSRARAGQSAVEFALVAVVALTLIFGVIQAGLLIYAYSFVSYAARSAVRYAMVHGSSSASPATNASVQSYVQSLAIALNTASLTVTTTWSPNEDPGSTVTVKVNYTYDSMLPFFSPSTITMSSTAQGLISN
jgi:Flp pilus assembly protein TadG